MVRESQIGLSSKEAVARLQEYGENKLEEKNQESLAGLFVRQFKDVLVMILLVSTVASFVLGEYTDGVVILAIVLVNAVFGFVQEYRAERSLRVLQQMTAPTCTVIRDGDALQISAQDVVPGDRILLQEGGRVPADGELVKADSLSIDESALTGESHSVDKAVVGSRPNLPLAEQQGAVFMGTLVVSGRGEAVVQATGMNTQIGSIAGMIKETPTERTPLQRRLHQLGRVLAAVCLAIVAIVFLAGVGQGVPAYKMFLTAVSLAVAAIPEGLPAVVTIALAVGVQRLIRSRAIVRRLPAVETLGCATVICSDKTGTLTQNKMAVESYWLAGQNQPLNSGTVDEQLRLALEIGVLCSHSSRRSGEPMEQALVRAAEVYGLDNLVERRAHVVQEIPFNSKRKMMSICLRDGDQWLSYVKGAPDTIMQRSTKMLRKDKVIPFDGAWKKKATEAVTAYGQGALRVIALAYRTLPTGEPNKDDMEQDLIFVGLAAISDPVRPGAKRAIQLGRRAGVRTIMITGDHPATATAVAEKLHLLTGSGTVMTGEQWQHLSPTARGEAVKNVQVFARVAPEDKLGIVRALRASGEVVAMTGDGVNDAPAVKAADIGVSMGISGTDVTRESSDMVLVDDDYASIVAAIEEGRAIYSNIRKFIRYLLTCNTGEVLTMFVAAATGLPLPLIPVQILWVNLVTDGLPAIALGVDRSQQQDVMDQPPRSPKEGIFARGLHIRILMTGVAIAAASLAVFTAALWSEPQAVEKARTLAFTTLVMSQLVFVFQCRSEAISIGITKLSSNPTLNVAVCLSAMMHCVSLYEPSMQNLFRTVPLTIEDWLLVGSFSLLPLCVETSVGLFRQILGRYFAYIRV